MYEASEKKIQSTLRQLTKDGETKQLIPTIKSIIQEEYTSLFQSSEKRLSAMMEQTANKIAFRARESEVKEEDENGNAWERSVVPRPSKRKRNAISGSQLSLHSQNIDNSCCEAEQKRRCADEVSNRIREAVQHKENASNLFLIDDFFLSVCFEVEGK